ncbi:MAG: aminotransferase class V-fold PLP-dependent enzyme [Candidatus Sedimenticola sp. 20ELBAFRAG]
MPSQFKLNEDVIYLNHAAVSPWPVKTADVVKAFAHENQVQGSKNYLQWMKTESQLRSRLASLINARSADEISLLKSTSEALSTVAYGLEWKPGDNVVLFKQEFPSNRIVWESLKSRGVEVRELEIHGTQSPEDALISSCDARTRLVTVSSVQYADGFRADLNKLGSYCRSNDILFCVDAIQSLGALQFDAQACHADFVMADGHKWMMGPEGLALFYVREEIRDQLTLNQYGWHMVANPGHFDTPGWEVSPTGTRFECGSPNMLAIHALNASLGLIEEIGIREIEASVLSNSQYLMEMILNEPKLILISDTDMARRSGIVTFKVNNADSTKIYENLMSKSVICAARGGGIRFSPHFYNTKNELKKAVEISLNASP